MTTPPLPPPLPDGDLAPILNENRDGWNVAMNVRFVRVTTEEVVAEWTVGPEHLQAYGIVHGGVYAGVIETLASVGAGFARWEAGDQNALKSVADALVAERYFNRFLDDVEAFEDAQHDRGQV